MKKGLEIYFPALFNFILVIFLYHPVKIILIGLTQKHGF